MTLANLAPKYIIVQEIFLKYRLSLFEIVVFFSELPVPRYRSHRHLSV